MCTRASDGLHVVCCMLYAACCILHLACCILRATRCMPHVGCCTLSVVCWMLYMNMLHCTSLVARCIMPRRIQAHRRVARPPALLSAAPRRSVYHGYHNGYGRRSPTGSDFKLNATPSGASSSQATKRTQMAPLAWQRRPQEHPTLRHAEHAAPSDVNTGHHYCRYLQRLMCTRVTRS
jgi:hypothetical protein